MTTIARASSRARSSASMRRRNSRTIRAPMPTAIPTTSTSRGGSPSSSAPIRTIATPASPISMARTCRPWPAARRRPIVANEKYCTQPGAARRTGNLPSRRAQGVHSADDVVLTAMGPGAEQFHGRIDNTRVFRVMATALGLAPVRARDKGASRGSRHPRAEPIRRRRALLGVAVALLGARLARTSSSLTSTSSTRASAFAATNSPTRARAQGQAGHRCAATWRRRSKPKATSSC